MATATIHFYNPINVETARIFRNLCLNALMHPQQRPDSLEIMFSSAGGNVQAGITMYEFLRTAPVPVTMCNVGSVESVSIIVFLGADKRIAMPNTHFKLHAFEWSFSQPAVAYSGIADAYLSLNNDIERYANIFEERTKGATRKIDIRSCLRGNPLILSNTESTAAGITTMEAGEVKLKFPGMHIYH
ncbi:MAG: ATP-dependent Clp protease proteolytic subunit [Clostridiales bacterium]|nr:ATP-dependent Clp protease proteolytic subunit [Clostridiales bacterium]